MKRILQINGHAIMNRGVEKYLLDVYKETDKSKYQFDFMTPLECHNNQFRATVESLGGRIIELKGSDNKILNKLIPLKIWSYLKKHPYEIVHVHTGNVILMALFAAGAKLAGTKLVFVHAHNAADMRTGVSKKSYKNLFADFFMLLFCDGYYGCSHKAAKYMFPRRIVESVKYTIIPNGIDVERFCFNRESRDEIRELLGLENDILLGCIGAFVNQKNHCFLVQLMEALKAKGYLAKLLLVGEGALQKDIRDRCLIAGVEDRVIFYGTSNQIPALLSAMDVLVMPSLYEGFPVVGIEAQASGLNCVLSSEITSEIKLTNYLVQLPIHTPDAVNTWAEKIISMKINSFDDRVEINRSMLGGTYDIKNSAKIFESIYGI